MVEDIKDEESNIIAIKLLWGGEDKPTRKIFGPRLLIVVPINLDKSQYYLAT